MNNCSDSRALFKMFSSLLCPPPPPPSSTLTADDFATFFTNKTKTISDQFLTPQTNNNFITTNTQSLTSFSPLSETKVSKLPGPADLPYTTLGRLGPSCQSKPHNSLSKLLFSPDWTTVMLSWRAFPHVLSSLCN